MGLAPYGSHYRNNKEKSFQHPKTIDLNLKYFNHQNLILNMIYQKN